ncbi:ComEC/Rec2 family competence protein [Rahnella perminowiae]|uniref:ComEC/Rec2 family competence protein n=1 Tax=Rahnella perminowiae TaxID=2816244 RepID=UPI001C25E24B|nr:MBL fold metallo-hydrolase [Rahnella perminowiae]MBU9824910.1 MBL fold metallo-hydrolase [Rahnella perminowiae]
MAISVRVLQANHGDCILVTSEDQKCVSNLLIDGGNGATFAFGERKRFSGALRRVLDELKGKGQKIDLAILTHIDDDHIGGLLRAFEKPGYLSEMVSSIWFNSSRSITNHFNVAEISDNDIHLCNDSLLTSVRQGKNLEVLLNEISCERQPVVMAGQRIVKGAFKFTILSPDEDKLSKLLHKWPDEPDPVQTSAHTTDYELSLKEIWSNDKFETDASDYNGSSIAFILEVEENKLLFLGDSHDEIIVRNLRALGFSKTQKLALDLVKISHHGSQYNTSPEFLSLVDANKYVISTNGAKHGLPNKRTIARILASGEGEICFNYPNVITPLLHEDEAETYSSRLVALDGEIRL